MNRSKFAELYNRIMRGDKYNIPFQDVCAFVEAIGFSFRRQPKSSHRIYKMKSVQEIINLQNDKGCAKPYQIDQIRKILKKYKIGGSESEED